MKMAIKKFKKSIEKWDSVSLDELNNIYKFVDKCVKIGVIKKKNWARKKSNMAKLFSTTQKAK
jgi:ribosomal protein S20